MIRHEQKETDMDKFSFAEAIAEKIMEMNEGTEAVAIHTTKNNSVELAWMRSSVTLPKVVQTLARMMWRRLPRP